MTTQQTTTAKKYHGWTSETIVNKGGFQFQVYTNKQSDGTIRSTAQKLLNNSNTGDAQIISFICFDNDPDNRITLLSKKATATEQNIKSFHAEALAIFENYQLKSVKPLEPGVNTIFWMEGYSHYKGEIGNEYICYAVETDKWGTTYKCVEPTELKFLNIDHPRHETKRFGIGHYYNESYVFIGSEDDLNNIIIEAHQATKEREAAAEIAKQEAAKLQAEKDAFLSQYQNADVRKTGALLKAYAKTLGIHSVSVKYDSFSMGNSYDITYQATEENETFENLCNSLQTASYNAYEDYWDSKGVEPVILEGYILNAFKYVHVKFEQITPSAPKNNMIIVDASTSEQKSGLTIQDYSEKAIVLRGETKPIKDQLKELGGSFNFKLKGGAGWIFSKKRESEIRKIFNL
jgi:hypothetical protein